MDPSATIGEVSMSRAFSQAPPDQARAPRRSPSARSETFVLTLPDGKRLECQQVCDFLELQQFDLVGVSMGGAVAIEFAAAHHHRVQSLVLIAPAAVARY